MKLSKNYKSFQKAYKIYQAMLEKDEILQIKEIEDLGKFFGKKGNPLKKKTKSEKAKKEFNEALKRYNKRFGTGAKDRLKKEAKKQEDRLEKAIRTSEAKRGNTTFETIAKRELQKRKEEAKSFASGVISNLRDKLNIKSDVVHYLATEQGFTEKMIENYLENMEREYDMLTPTAKALADMDSINKSLKALSDYYGQSGVAGILDAYLKGIDRKNTDGMIEAFDFYFSRQEEAPMSFEEFAKALEDYEEWGEKNFEEIFDKARDEESEGE